MSELEVKGNIFYILRIREGDAEKLTLHDDFDSAVARLKEGLKTSSSPEHLELMSIDVKGEKFEIKGVPWSTIAAELVK